MILKYINKKGYIQAYWNLLSQTPSLCCLKTSPFPSNLYTLTGISFFKNSVL